MEKIKINKVIYDESKVQNLDKGLLFYIKNRFPSSLKDRLWAILLFLGLIITITSCYFAITSNNFNIALIGILVSSIFILTSSFLIDDKDFSKSRKRYHYIINKYPVLSKWVDGEGNFYVDYLVDEDIVKSKHIGRLDKVVKLGLSESTVYLDKNCYEVPYNEI